MFRIETSTRKAGGVEQTVYTLSNADGSVQAEVWPGQGCNCLRWRVPGPTGPLELLYVAPDWESNPVPTRSGNPVLFPFPNRIRDGHFVWDGKEYQLPINGPGGKHAIHGFVCRKPWRVVRQEAQDERAQFYCEFQLSIDAQDQLTLWPTDFRISLLTTLTQHGLGFAARVENPTDRPLPFGLGYHAYFSIPFTSNGGGANCLISAPASSIWELEDGLPTGKRTPVPSGRDLRAPRKYAELSLDDVYSDLKRGDKLRYPVARIEQPYIGTLEVQPWRDFRELVVFTPPHRKAICLEPYTCVTDAVNLQAQGIDAGWRVLAPGNKTELVLEYTWAPAS
jgi:aldose 1-epimerase